MAPVDGRVQDRAAVGREPGGERPTTTRSVGETTAARTTGVAGKPAGSPFTRLRLLFAYYWRPLLTLIALVPSLLAILHTLGLPVSKWPEQADPVTRGVLIGLGIVLLVVIRFPKVAYFITKLIVPSPPLPPERPRVFRGLLQYDKGDAARFHGRTIDGDACWDRIRRKPFFILEGESGCGKSSLLNVDLLPRAHEAFRVIACRCGEDPFGKLRSALLDEPYERGQRYGKPALKQAIETVSKEPGDGPPRPLLVCVDQFEELFVTVKDQVRRQFVATLKEAIEDSRLRLVLVIRNDFCDLLLDACRDVDPDHDALVFDRESYYTLRSFTADQAEGVVKQMLDRDEIHGGDPLRRWELEEFAGALVQELLRPPLDKRLSPEDEMRVLPVELQMVGYTHESILGVWFTAAELRRRGGKAGLYRRYIEDAKDYVFRKTGVSGETALLALRRLISPAGTKGVQSVKDITASQTGLTPRQVADVLQAFTECYLVRQVRSESAIEGMSGVEPRCYELMHEHLVHLLAEAQEPALQRIRDAEARLSFWRDRTRYLDGANGQKLSKSAHFRFRDLKDRFLSLYIMPIPIGETFGLWQYTRDREDRRMLSRNFRGFLARWLTFLVVIAAPFVAWMFYERTPAHQVQYIIDHARDKDLTTSDLQEEQSSLKEWLSALVMAGRPEPALETAAEITNPLYQSQAYAAIAEVAAKVGDRDRATQAIDTALATAAKITNQSYHSHSHVYVPIASSSASARQLDKSLFVPTAESLDPSIRSRAYAAIAVAAAKVGDGVRAKQAIEEALTAAKITDPEAYAAIAKAAAKAGQLDTALATAAKITDNPAYQSQAYAAIAEAAAKAGQLDTALATAAKIMDPWSQSQVYPAIAEAAAKAGRLDGVLATAAKNTDNPAYQSQAYAAIAEAAAKAGDRDRATQAINTTLTLASKITDPEYQSEAYAVIAEAAAKAGQLDTALATAAKITDPEAYAAIAEAAAKAGQLDTALATAAKITDPATQSQAYAAIAEAAAKAGDRDRATQAINTTLTLASKIRDPRDQSQAYAAIAEAAAKVGQLDGVLATAAKITDPATQSQAYAAIAEAAAKVGQLDGVLTAASKITDPWSQAQAYSAIVEGAARAGQLRIARKAERRISGKFHYAAWSRARSAIAQALARDQRFYANLGYCERHLLPILDLVVGEQRFYEARVYCEPCERDDKLRAYTTILTEYAKRYAQSAAERKP